MDSFSFMFANTYKIDKAYIYYIYVYTESKPKCRLFSIFNAYPI